MDPNAALRHIRRLVTEWRETDDTGDATEILQRLSDSVAALDTWLSTGGFVPDPWRSTTTVHPDFVRMHDLAEAIAANPSYDQEANELADLFLAHHPTTKEIHP